MSLRPMLVLAAELGLMGIGAVWIGARPVIAAEPMPSPVVQTSSVSPSETIARSPKQLREAFADAMRLANVAKGSKRADVVNSLLDIYRDLGRDILLPAKERLRLGVQVRARLQRFASELRYEVAHNNSRPATSASQSGAAGGAAVEGLDSLVDVIQATIGRPDDWVLQGENGAALAGGAGAGIGGGAPVGRGGGAFGNGDALAKAADANGADLVDLIEKTIDPPSWDVNGGVGTIMYFNNLRVLVVRQTGEGQEDVGGALGGLRKN